MAATGRDALAQSATADREIVISRGDAGVVRPPRSPQAHDPNSAAFHQPPVKRAAAVEQLLDPLVLDQQGLGAGRAQARLKRRHPEFSTSEANRLPYDRRVFLRRRPHRMRALWPSGTLSPGQADRALWRRHRPARRAHGAGGLRSVEGLLPALRRAVHGRGIGSTIPSAPLAISASSKNSS
jgi:hypothetical protein